jgi:hypothetical protein
MTSFGDMDLYAELEIPRTSTPEEIKKAYRKLAMVKIQVIIFRNGILIKIKTIQTLLKNSKE